MGETAAAPPPGKPAGRPVSRLLAYVSALLSFVGVAAGVIVFFDTSLPGCENTGVSETLHRLLREKNVADPKVTERREVSNDPFEIRCAAALEAGDGNRYDLTYRIYRDEAGGKVTLAAEWRRL